MSDLSPLIDRFASQEFAFRRLHSADPDFRVVCEDYLAAAEALKRFKSQGAAFDGRVEEYRTLLAELEDEISEALSNSLPPFPDKSRNSS